MPVFAPPKRRRTGLIVGISLGAVALLCLCIVAGLGSLGGLAYFGYRLDRADAIGALDDYLSDVVAQRYDEAYGQLCGSVRARHSLPDFESQMRETGLTSYHIGGDTYTTRDQESGYLIDVDETLATGATMPRKYFVVGGGYDICPTHL